MLVSTGGLSVSVLRGKAFDLIQFPLTVLSSACVRKRCELICKASLLQRTLRSQLQEGETLEG